MPKILIPGGSGLVGKHLIKLLQNAGHEVAILSRKPHINSNIRSFVWDINAQTIDAKAIEWADVVVNLAGAGVADHRWTQAYKEEIYNSRILSTRLLVQEIIRQKKSLLSFINASAIGFYGYQTPENTPETHAASTVYLAKVCADWENECKPLADAGIPLSIVRIGVVLATEGGFVAEVGGMIKKWIGTPLGSGKQQTSWIHINDLCRLFAFLIENPSLAGIYNGVAPHPVSNAQITQLLANALNRSIILPPAPAFVIRLLFGEMADMLLASQHVSAQKALKNGFSFEFAHAEEAILNLTTKKP